MSSLEIGAFILNVLGVWLTSKQYRICWLVNIVAVCLYMVIFYQVHLYADALLQAVFALLQVYGWYSWSKHTNQQRIRVGNIAPKSRYLHLGIGAILGLGLGSLFAYFTEAHLPWLDSMLAAMSLVATYWAAKKYIQSWGLWCVLDVIYVGMYSYKSLYLTAFLYFIFILLALNGWRMWRQQANQSVLATTRNE